MQRPRLLSQSSESPLHTRLHRYERLTQVPLLALAVIFLATYAWPIIDPGLPDQAQTVCATTGVAIWIVFLADYLIRLGLAHRRWAFVRRTWFDLLTLALPMLRPLRALRVVLVLRMVGRASATFARGRVVASVALLVVTTGAVAALAVLDAERANPDANIRDYADAAWWALSTITTVGYGDRYPTTGEGRLIAAGLMVAGIALLGVITASLASWFVERIGEVGRAEHDTQAKLDALTREVQALRQLLSAPEDPSNAVNARAVSD
jgi:voltage-gated potassium channel